MFDQSHGERPESSDASGVGMYDRSHDEKTHIVCGLQPITRPSPSLAVYPCSLAQ
jgi:hypothetical protein